MSRKIHEIVLYHSMLCPRCALSKLVLRSVLKKHPDVRLEKVDVLTNLARARKDGVRTIPALAARGQVLTGLLTPARIERFIETLDAANPLA